MALDDLWNNRYSKQTQSNNVKIYINDVLNYFPKEKKLNSFMKYVFKKEGLEAEVDENKKTVRLRKAA